jgi:hypothetical protein
VEDDSNRNTIVKAEMGSGRPATVQQIKQDLSALAIIKGTRWRLPTVLVSPFPSLWHPASSFPPTHRRPAGRRRNCKSAAGVEARWRFWEKQGGDRRGFAGNSSRRCTGVRARGGGSPWCSLFRCKVRSLGMVRRWWLSSRRSQLELSMGKTLPPAGRPAGWPRRS